jgi:hypothetical protein
MRFDVVDEACLDQYKDGYRHKFNPNDPHLNRQPCCEFS